MSDLEQKQGAPLGKEYFDALSRARIREAAARRAMMEPIAAPLARAVDRMRDVGRGLSRETLNEVNELGMYGTAEALQAARAEVASLKRSLEEHRATGRKDLAEVAELARPYAKPGALVMDGVRRMAEDAAKWRGYVSSVNAAPPVIPVDANARLREMLHEDFARGGQIVAVDYARHPDHVVAVTACRGEDGGIKIVSVDEMENLPLHLAPPPTPSKHDHGLLAACARGCPAFDPFAGERDVVVPSNSLVRAVRAAQEDDGGVDEYDCLPDA